MTNLDEHNASHALYISSWSFEVSDPTTYLNYVTLYQISISMLRRSGVGLVKYAGTTIEAGVARLRAGSGAGRFGAPEMS